MSSSSLIVAGSRILAAQIAGIAPLAVIKPTDEPVTSSTTLQNDNDLIVSVAANSTWLFLCMLDYEGGTQGASDIKWLWSIPAGASLRYHGIHDTTGGASVAGTTYTGATTVTSGSNGAGVLKAATMIGSLNVSSSAGSVQLTWAQNSSSGTPTIVHAQSLLALWRIT